MRLIVNPDYDRLSKWAADYIAYKIMAARPTAQKPYVMMLPTGSSPLGVFKRLIEMFKKGKISFQHVVFFHMDEYIGLSKDDPNSYGYFLWDNFFQHIDIKKQNIHLLNGQTKDFVKECQTYEKLIRSYGGLDIVLGGVGENGHIAFNEPGSSLRSRTRVKTLNRNTLEANARFFNNDINQVPKYGLTVGIATIMDAKEVMILVSGGKKAQALHCAVEGAINHMCPISILQMHPCTLIVCDEAATVDLRPDTVRYFKSNEEQKLPS